MICLLSKIYSQIHHSAQKQMISRLLEGCKVLFFASDKFVIKIIIQGYYRLTNLLKKIGYDPTIIWLIWLLKSQFLNLYFGFTLIFFNEQILASNLSSLSPIPSVIEFTHSSTEREIVSCRQFQVKSLIPVFVGSNYGIIAVHPVWMKIVLFGFHSETQLIGEAVLISNTQKMG